MFALLPWRSTRPLWAINRCLSSQTGSGSITSSDLIAKWQGILQLQAQEPPGHEHFSNVKHHQTSGLLTDQLRQLCQDAIHGELDCILTFV